VVLNYAPTKTSGTASVQFFQAPYVTSAITLTHEPGITMSTYLGCGVNPACNDGQ
jgi:hypothetical protein